MRLNLIILLLFTSLNILAQHVVVVTFEPKPGFANKKEQIIKTNKFSDADSILKTYITILQNNGYFLPNINQFASNDSVFLVINAGKQFKQYIIVNAQNVLLDATANINGLNSKFNYRAYVAAVNKILQYYQNNGFPFVKIWADSVVIGNDTVLLKLIVNSGTNILFDTISYAGTASIKSKFLHHYLNIKVGGFYNENLIANAAQKLSSLPYVQVYANPGVYFYGNKAKPYLYLNNKNANTFFAAVGVAPNSTVNNKLLVTGEASLQLQNLLGSGKSFTFNYKSFLAGSQDVDVNFNWPYIFNLKIGADYTFKLLKFDSLFSDITYNIGVKYLFTGVDFLKCYFEQQNVFALKADTAYVKTNKRLPAYNDVVNRMYGFTININRLNYQPNPSKGFFIQTHFAAGFRQILRNNAIDNLKITNNNKDYYSIYDSLKLQTLQYKAGLNTSYYYKLSGLWVLHHQCIAGYVFAENLFINDLYRIGGLKTLRGFDEQSIFADRYGILNSEIRYLMNKNSNIMLFYNAALYSNKASSNAINNAHGFGAGVNLQNSNGIFSLFYALGKINNSTINFNQAKIHFGYINYF